MIDYSIIQDEKTDYVAVRSTVNSFGLDHVTDKDITTFFSEFSKYAHIDTGLLPLNGTGLLAYRQAANHSQIVIQHEPGVYRIMWGQHEGDSSAKHYFLAQPYRIVIGDIVDGSLLGARMFYSPVPITSPSNPLYHVNLPNINCRGYRNNGVGWVCLYHNEDWSEIPIGDKVTRLMERCSGAEAYNDANMSETDGPRFYASKSKPVYLTSPTDWEQKTTEEGHLWTLDPDLWIPILVKDRDNQGQHDDNGVPLTLGMALTGDYRAYYYDNITTKPVNAIAREDKQYPHTDVFSIVKKAYVQASNNPKDLQKLDPYAHSIIVRSEYSLTAKSNPLLDQDEDQPTCADCDEPDTQMHTIYNDSVVCSSCIENYNLIYPEEEYYHIDDCVWVESKEQYYLSTNSDLRYCYECCEHHIQSGSTSPVVTKTDDASQYLCLSCAHELAITKCQICYEKMIFHPDYQTDVTELMSVVVDSNAQETQSHISHYCPTCITKVTVCPCGYIRSSGVFQHFEADEWSLIALSGSQEETTCCKSCATADENGNIIYAQPIKSAEVAFNLQSIKAFNAVSINKKVKDNQDDEPF
jgi:hypothetical protein